MQFATHFRMLTLFAALAISLSAKAQTSAFKPEWSVGVNAGINFPRIDFNPSVRNASLTGKTLGASVRYTSEKNFGISAELNYSELGFRQNFEDYDPSYAYTREMNYLSLPVMTHIYFGKKARFVFHVGPQLNLLLSNREAYSESLSTLIASGKAAETLGVAKHFGKSIDRRFDYGIALGTGMELRSPVGEFMLEGRYYLGLGDVFNNSRSDYFSRSAHRVASVKLTYFIKSF